MQDDISSSRRSRVPSCAGEFRQDSSIETGPSADRMTVDVTAAVIALRDEQPVVLIQGKADGETVALPCERYRACVHASLEDAIRDRIVAQMGIRLGYIEQLTTDLKTQAPERGALMRTAPGLSVGYLGLLRLEGNAAAQAAPWMNCYEFLPWEDWRRGRPEILSATLLPRLLEWAAGETPQERAASELSRHDRLRIAFAIEGGKWDDERVAERLDILDAAGLVPVSALRQMRADHRRILAAALARLRAKIRNRPLVFELLPPEFTLFELQKTVEAILGPHLHKQNFRRLVEGTGLVVSTGEVRTHTGGRPAKLFRFRREVLLERPAPGVRVKAGRAA